MFILNLTDEMFDDDYTPLHTKKDIITETFGNMDKTLHWSITHCTQGPDCYIEKLGRLLDDVDKKKFHIKGCSVWNYGITLYVSNKDGSK